MAEGRWAIIIKDDPTAVLESDEKDICLQGEPVTVTDLINGRAHAVSTGLRNFKIEMDVSCLRGLN